jgi:hypothetical protein
MHGRWPATQPGMPFGALEDLASSTQQVITGDRRASVDPHSSPRWQFLGSGPSVGCTYPNGLPPRLIARPGRAAERSRRPCRCLHRFVRIAAAGWDNTSVGNFSFIPKGRPSERP